MEAASPLHSGWFPGVTLTQTKELKVVIGGNHPSAIHLRTIVQRFINLPRVKEDMIVYIAT